jgi:hypothetical protein
MWPGTDVINRLSASTSRLRSSNTQSAEYRSDAPAARQARDPAIDLTAAQRRIAQQEASILSLKQTLRVTRGELEESAYESAQAAAAERSAPERALLAAGLDLETQAQMQLLADQIAPIKL